MPENENNVNNEQATEKKEKLGGVQGQKSSNDISIKQPATPLYNWPQWLTDAVSLENAGREDEALDLVYRNVDELLRNGQFNDVETLIREVNVDDLPTDVMLGILSITLSARGHLPSRTRFVNQARILLGWRGEDVSFLLKGLA